MKTINITKLQKERARVRFEFDRLQNSIMEGRGNLFGALGEVLIYDEFKKKGFKVLDQSSFDFDLIINNAKIDVKTKKIGANMVPNEEFACNVSAFNTKQQCDFYFFIGITEDYEKAFFYGYIKPEEFYKKAKFYKEGEKGPSGFVYKCDSYEVKIKDLEKFKK